MDAPQDPSPVEAGHSLYNPFGTIGVVVQVPAPPASAPSPADAGDWSLPVAVALAGFALIGWLMRHMVA